VDHICLLQTCGRLSDWPGVLTARSHLTTCGQLAWEGYGACRVCKPHQILGGARPFRSQSGHELVYGSGDALVAVSYTVRGDTFVADKPREWMAKPGKFRDADLAPDGKRFLVLSLRRTPAAGARWKVTALDLTFAERQERYCPVGQPEVIVPPGRYRYATATPSFEVVDLFAALIHGHHDECSVVLEVVLAEARHVVQNPRADALRPETPSGARRSNHSFVAELLVVIVRRFRHAVRR